MTCDECEKWRLAGARFCAKCGMLLVECPECQMWRGKGANYCRNCGARLHSVRTPTYSQAGPANSGGFFSAIVKAATVIFVLAVIAALISDVINIGNILNDIEGLRLSIYIPLGLTDISLFRISGIWLDIYFVAELVLITYFLIYAVRRAYVVKAESNDDPDRMEHTGISASATFICVSLFLTIVYLLSMASGGQNADTSWLDKFTHWQLAFMLTNAGVQEELAYRMLTIGVPIAFVTVLKYRDAKCLKMLLGGFGMNKLAFVLIVVSSLAFGLAHNDGWGWVKVIDAFASGLFFAYIYTEYGLYACVLMHVVNDTLSLFPGGILVEFAIIALGLVLLIYWLIKPNRAVFDVKNMPDLPERPTGGLLSLWDRH